MESLTRTAAIDGPEPVLVTVECSVTSGFAGLQLIGNTSDLCRDGKERAKSALEKLGYRFGQKRILINLAPADCRKEGNHFDLPIAVSLAALERDEPMAVEPHTWLFAAELSVDGKLRPIKALIPMALAALQGGLKGMVLAGAHRREMATLKKLPALDGQLEPLFFDHLEEVMQWLFHGVLPTVTAGSADRYPPSDEAFGHEKDFDDMLLSPELENLALTAAVGRHSLLLRGSPGAGKSMFAQRLPSILPSLAPKVHFEVLQIYSLQHQILPAELLRGRPPFRHPHHSASAQALLGTADEPGDLALAHGGLLFLDEIPEFRRDLLESLREPLEQRMIFVSRAQRKTRWPASLQFVAACNNCPCGWYGSSKRLCRCSTQKILKYAQRLSGPLLDRIDIHFTMPELNQEQWFNASSLSRGQTRALRERVERAREFSLRRNEKWGGASNAELGSEALAQALECTEERYRSYLIELAGRRLSNRAMMRCLRVARTLADLDAKPAVEPEHLAKAMPWHSSQVLGQA